jgi:uncharacterized protein (TIGR02145 family)
MNNNNGIWTFLLVIMEFVLILAISCKKESNFNEVADIDGNVYKTVTIGTQIWLSENLKTTKYNDGTTIPLVTDNAAWTALNSAGYCWYNNDTVNKRIYGALYNWYAVNTDKLCPTGWHIPTEADWLNLINYLGGANIAGGKMKEIGLTHWKEQNVGATNESGFTAIPGGLRSTFGDFGTLGIYGRWWSSTPYSLDPQFAVSVEIDNDSAEAYIEHVTYAGNGESVRCLKD